MKLMLLARRGLRQTLTLALFGCAVPSLARAAGSDTAAAEVLFREANQLAKEGDFEKACGKYEASQKLDPALGTMLRLADCWERVGRTASAWGMFLDAAAVAKRLGEAEREVISRERADALEPQLTRVRLRAPATLPPGYRVFRGDQVLDAAIWNSPLPVDPGWLVIQASAPGYRKGEVRTQISAGSEIIAIDLPILLQLPAAQKSSPNVLSRARPAPPAEPTIYPTLGWIQLGMGVLGGAVAGGLGAYALSKNDESLGSCSVSDPNQCSSDGKAARDEALLFADVSTVAFAASGAVLVSGIGFLLFAPRIHEPTQVGALRLAPMVLPEGGGFSFRGAL